VVVHCALDPITMFLLKECIDILFPFLTAMVSPPLSDASLLMAEVIAAHGFSVGNCGSIRIRG